MNKTIENKHKLKASLANDENKKMIRNYQKTKIITK